MFLFDPPWQMLGTPLTTQLQMLVLQQVWLAPASLSAPTKNTAQLAIMTAIRIKRICYPSANHLDERFILRSFVN
jgi:hypothetical protein